MKYKQDLEKPLVFLSHSHRDGKLATSLARAIERAFDNTVEVFNTSEPEHRLEDFDPAPGSLWSEEWTEYEAQTKDQLAAIIERARAYVLLVTARSLRENSEWVRYEMTVADSVQVEGRCFFLPMCSGRRPTVPATGGVTILSRHRSFVACRFRGVDPHFVANTW